MSTVPGALVLHAAKTGEAAKAGPIGLAVILILAIACYFLFKSMSRHMRNVRENFPTDGSVDDHGRPAESGVPRATPVATRPGGAEPAGAEAAGAASERAGGSAVDSAVGTDVDAAEGPGDGPAD